MFALIFTVLFSVVVAYFATQNTGLLTIHFASYTWSGIPIYLVMLGSLLVGLLFAWIFHILTAISASLTIKGKNKAIKDVKNENLELTKKVHQLELKNTKLTANEEDETLMEDDSL